MGAVSFFPSTCWWDFRFSWWWVWRWLFWDVAPCSLVQVYQRFRGAYCLHHQGYITPRLSDYRTQYPTRQSYCNVFVGSIHDGTLLLLHSKFNTQLLITNNSALNTTGATNFFKSQHTTNSFLRSLCRQQRHNHRNVSVTIVAFVIMLLVNRPSVSIVTLLRKRKNVVLSHWAPTSCYQGNLTCNNIELV
jgi:hypothetical protein